MMRCISVVVALLLACSASAFAPSCFMGASMQRTAVAGSASRSCEVRTRRCVLRTKHAVESAIALLLYAVPVLYDAIARACIEQREQHVLLCWQGSCVHCAGILLLLAGLQAPSMLFGGGNKDDKGAGGGGVSEYNSCNVYTAYSCQFSK
jgi:hypothetical protein